MFCYDMTLMVIDAALVQGVSEGNELTPCIKNLTKTVYDTMHFFQYEVVLLIVYKWVQV